MIVGEGAAVCCCIGAVCLWQWLRTLCGCRLSKGKVRVFLHGAEVAFLPDKIGRFV